MSRYYEKQREERGLGSRAEQTDWAIVSLTHEVGELRRQGSSGPEGAPEDARIPTC